jgi:rhodanese-related sulfurtransferase
MEIKPSLLRGLIIILLGTGLGFAANQISPRGIPLITPPNQPALGEIIDLNHARALWQNGTVLFLDARQPDDYAAGHIGNALNLPALSFDQHFGEIAPLLTPHSELVLYCDGTECDLSHRLADNLRQLGYTNLHILFNGWTVWNQAGLPVTRGGPG